MGNGATGPRWRRTRQGLISGPAAFVNGIAAGLRSASAQTTGKAAMPLMIHPVTGKQKSWDLCNAFLAGAPKNAPDAHVFYGVDDSNIAEWRRVQREQLPFFYIDNSYFDCVRGRQFRITKNGIQHDGLGDTDGQRFKALGVTVKPQRDAPGGHIVACHQSDAFMEHIARDPTWLHNVLKHIGPSVPIRHRRWQSDKMKLQSTLLADLQGASELVTHSSAAAVTAVLEGV